LHKPNEAQSMKAGNICGILFTFACIYQSIEAVWAQGLEVRAGSQQIIFESGFQNTTHFPDQPLSFLSLKPLAFYVVCNGGTKLFYGPSFDNLVFAEFVLRPGQANEFDNGYAGIGGIYKDGNKVFGLYHAEDHVGKESAVSKLRGQYAAMFSIGLVRSDDGGRTFQKLGQALTSKHPYKQGLECGGVGDVTMCLDKTGKYLLCYYADFARGQGKGIQICAARCPVENISDPLAWMKFHDGKYNEPGIAGQESYVLSLHEKDADAWSPHVTYSRELDRYFLTFLATFHNETDGVTWFRPKQSGIYISDSTDGINWNAPVCVFVDSNLFLRGSSGSQHPTLHVDGKIADGVKGTLFYAHTEKWPDIPHHLAARSIRISLRSKTSQLLQPKGRTSSIGNDKSKSNGTNSSPKPILYLSGDSSKPTVPASINFKRMEGDFVEGRIGKGVYFNGSTFSEIDVGLPQGNSARSLALWIKNDRGPVNQNIHIVTQGPLEKAKPFGIMEAGTKWRFFDINGGLDSGVVVDKD
jgi:hypothetical protein